MPAGLSSPRSRAAALADMGERSAFVARQRVGRSKRPRPGRRARLRRLLGTALTIVAVAAAGGAALRWLLTTQHFAVASVQVRGVSRVPPDQILALAAAMHVSSGRSADELASLRPAPGPKARAAIGVIRALLRSGNGLTAEISEIDMSRREGPVLYTVDGVEVRLGTDDWDERLARLEGVLEPVATQDVRALGLRVSDER